MGAQEVCRRFRKNLMMPRLIYYIILRFLLLLLLLLHSRFSVALLEWLMAELLRCCTLKIAKTIPDSTLTVCIVAHSFDQVRTFVRTSVTILGTEFAPNSEHTPPNQSVSATT